jgi:hypothetical protein
MKSIDPHTPRFASPNDVRETRPFYLIVMAVLAGLYGLALYYSVELRAPEHLIPFTLLMLLHAGLHWNSPRVVGNLRASIIYLVVQGTLVFVLPLIAQADYLVMGLSLALIGESVGILWNVTRIAIAMVVYLALAALDLLLLSESNLLPSWALAALPMTLFVIVYVVLYSRQAQARAHTHKRCSSNSKRRIASCLSTPRASKTSPWRTNGSAWLANCTTRLRRAWRA